MRKKAAYYLFSALIVLSGAFSIAPRAFCTMKPAAPQHSCCKPPVTNSAQCPICTYDLNKIEPSPANTSVKSQNVSPRVISLLSYAPHINSPDFGIAEYSVISYNDSSPPLYLQQRNLRI